MYRLFLFTVRGLLGGFLVFAFGVHAQSIATEVEKRVWVIDPETVMRGITLKNAGERVVLGVAANSVPNNTRVEMRTYASEYFLKIQEARRITPLYKVDVIPENGVLPEEGDPLLSMQIKYPDAHQGKKSVWVWGDDDIWRAIPSQSVPEKNLISTKISTGTTYFAVFSSDMVLEKGIASWYKYRNCLCAASPDYPKGTMVKVTNLANDKSIVVKINDFGPDRAIHPDRIIDLDYTAFIKLAGAKRGLINVKVEPVR